MMEQFDRALRLARGSSGVRETWATNNSEFTNCASSRQGGVVGVVASLHATQRIDRQAAVLA